MDALTNTIQNNLNIENSDALVYLRSSTKAQNIGIHHHSFATQSELCSKYATDNGLTIIHRIEETRRANDITKLKIYDIVNNYRNINIIIADPSRLSRNLINGALFLEKCKDLNIVIHFARDNITSDTHRGKRKIIDLFGIAEDESNTFSKRIKTMINIKKSLGSKFGRPSFGYEKYVKKYVNKRNNIQLPILKWKNNIYEQKVINLIKKLYYGSNIDEFYKLFRDIVNKPNIKLYYEGKEWKNIKHKECTYSYISNFLNKHNILKRGTKWNVIKISNILKTFKNNNDNEVQHIYQNIDDNIINDNEIVSDNIIDDEIVSDNIIDDEFISDNIIDDEIVSNNIINNNSITEIQLNNNSDNIIFNNIEDNTELNNNIFIENNNNNNNNNNKSNSLLNNIYNNILTYLNKK
jgi:DNA invertase Pin-like site-specific DNA recombinase